MPNQNDPSLTPKGGHEGGKPKNFRYMVAGLIIMFVIAAVIVATSTRILNRPGAEQTTVDKAPTD